MGIKNFIKRFPRSYQLQIDCNGRYLARSDGETVFLYCGGEYLEIAAFHDLTYVNKMKFSNDGKLLGVTSCEPELAVYDIAEMKLVCRIRFPETDEYQDGGFCFSPSNDYIYYVLILNDFVSAIARINISDQKYRIVFQFDNYRFEEVYYLDWKRAYIFYGKDVKTNKGFVLESGPGNGKYKKIFLKRYYKMFFPLPQAKMFMGIHNNIMHILKSDYTTSIGDFMPINEEKKELNFFNIISESTVLNEMFQDNVEEYERIKKDAESDALDVSVDGNVVCVALSYDMRYLLLATENYLKIFSYKGMRLLNKAQFVNISDVNFSHDNTHVLIGTWNYGYIYNIANLLS